MLRRCELKPFNGSEVFPARSHRIRSPGRTELGIGMMLNSDFFERSDAIFKELLDLANHEMSSGRLNVEPSVIVDRIICPLKALYLKNLSDLLQAFLEKKL